MDSLTVHCVVERPPHFVLAVVCSSLTHPKKCHPERSNSRTFASYESKDLRLPLSLPIRLHTHPFMVDGYGMKQLTRREMLQLSTLAAVSTLPTSAHTHRHLRQSPQLSRQRSKRFTGKG